MFVQHVKFRPLIRVTAIQQRQQTNAASVNVAETEATDTKRVEWDEARPYKAIPKVSLAYFVGNMLPGGKYYKKEFDSIMGDLNKRKGNLYRLPGIMGKDEMLVSNDASHFERVFRVEGPWPERQGSAILDYHRNKYQKDFYQGVEGLIATQAEVWSKFRSAVNPVMMQPKTVRLYYQKMSNVNKEFIQRIRDIRDSTTFEVPDTFEEEINRWTLESVSVIALDKQLGLINTNRDNPRAKMLFENLTDFFALAADIEIKPSLWRYIPTPGFKKMMRILDNIQEVTVSYVNEALERLEREPSNKPEHEQSVLEKLLKIDKKVATVMAMDMLMAGVDTTTTTFTGVLLCLAQNPDKQAKLREEVLRILPNKDSDFTEASMKNVPYLRACIKEALRVYPLTSGNIRVTKSDVIIDGYQIPKETAVIMSFLGFNKDDSLYPRSKEYLPERWLRQSKTEAADGKCPVDLKTTNPFSYLPFGFGPRMCVGKRIVEMELELGIARLIRNYNVEYNYSMEKPFKNLLINVPCIPLKFKFTDVEN
ncbi:LOW QUALITY PROTEIN: probable cytochrome P450 12a5, mitochondrial [Drosophila sulfurigaster albostrigata]|uniref:LOW QUALITY PROTEIN: probable cytochrome P450 12a5, mitochondrial n=1 Tax=Drosophila sulfurigaster albostrigata TaxID=89887 RepID=UPI002D219B89|nr:LOW QUALITY PROTEIN: probable cytochrome P450 12a5, mitochondrial [Drosophila sulfurigaster albostrigata]